MDPRAALGAVRRWLGLGHGAALGTDKVQPADSIARTVIGPGDRGLAGWPGLAGWA